MNTRIDALYAECAKVKNADNRREIDSLIGSGQANANSTVYDEKAAPEADWERIAIGSIESLLSEGGFNHHVVGWFARRGVAA